MHVTRLTLRDFRNYPEAALDLDAGVHVFEGANGQGKTNLIEAIGYLSTLSSHRVSSDAALVRFGESSAIVRAELAHGERQLAIDVEIQKSGANRARVSGRAVKARELPRYFTTVLFAPEDLSLVRGDPGQRRAFLDSLLVTHSPRLGDTMQQYERVLRQRNSLLKSARAGQLGEAARSTLEIWDEQLVSLGSVIVAERLALIERLVPHLERAYAALVGADHRPGISMRVSCLSDSGKPMDDDEAANDTTGVVTLDEIRERFTARLRDARPRELDRGISLVGPHRDDATFWLNGLPARITASHGESWSFALSLKLAAAQLVRAESRTGDPVLILDDVFAELDGDRRRRLADAIAGFEQVLITCAVVADIPEPLREHTIRIRAGKIIGNETEPEEDA
ncbi:DNA replication/repair protein RecF [Gulosibacter macacae]|uniref:DNA replication and repair protein RecF n=1 Tax=Gulosibacter macacae TaxID=2488791 RepID=A0A3P3VUN2_9MICO|nr:DNA replication/repair protein RecF [Gulosibacter macacae]RRJ86512.1 DNA replication/repair protein RecF [Gulosibacter macacae]